MFHPGEEPRDFRLQKIVRIRNDPNFHERIPCRAIASWSAVVLLPLSETDQVSRPMPFSLSPRERAGVRGIGRPINSWPTSHFRVMERLHLDLGFLWSECDTQWF